jgi:type I restriction enzyme S subunit
MKKGWQEVPLRDVLQDSERFEAPQPGVRYRQLGVRLWGEGAYEREIVDGANTQYAFFNRCESGDLVLNKIWARNGSVSIVPPSLAGCYVSAEFPLYRATEAVVPGWLRLITKSRWFWTACDEKARGSSGKNRIKPSQFLGIQIPLPPVVEQQRIVAHLDAIESRLTRAKKLREEQENELKTTLSSAFHKLEADVTWKPLAEVAPLAWRQIIIDPDESYTEFGVRSFYKGIFLRRKVAGSTFSWQELYRLKAGDIVFSNIMAWEKAIAIAHPEHDGWVGNHRMLVCEPRPDVVLPSYLLHYFMTSEGFAKILQASPGTAARNKTLKADNLMAIEVPIPSLSSQRTFESLCEHVARIRAAQKPQVTDAAKILPSLLNRIFNS